MYSGGGERERDVRYDQRQQNSAITNQISNHIEYMKITNLSLNPIDTLVLK